MGRACWTSLRRGARQCAGRTGNISERRKGGGTQRPGGSAHGGKLPSGLVAASRHYNMGVKTPYEFLLQPGIFSTGTWRTGLPRTCWSWGGKGSSDPHPMLQGGHRRPEKRAIPDLPALHGSGACRQPLQHGKSQAGAGHHPVLDLSDGRPGDLTAGSTAELPKKQERPQGCSCFLFPVLMRSSG